MPRQARNDYPGAFHHIISRAFKGKNLFNDNQDYSYFLDSLSHIQHYRFKILEFCLMSNHVHLLLKTGDVPLQKILKSLNTRFALYISRKRGYCGPVFQSRPKSILITSQKHLSIVARYILRNPIKANICRALNQYKWSSYKYLTLTNTPLWYDNTDILAEFSKNKITAIKEYKKFISKSLKSDEKDYPLDIFSKIAVGNKKEFEKILKQLKKDKRNAGKTFTRKINWQKRIDKIINNYGKNLDILKKDNSKKALYAKQKIAYIMKKLLLYDSKDIVKRLEISSSTLSRYVKHIKTKIKEGILNEGELF